MSPLMKLLTAMVGVPLGFGGGMLLVFIRSQPPMLVVPPEHMLPLSLLGWGAMLSGLVVMLIGWLTPLTLPPRRPYGGNVVPMRRPN